MEAADPTDDGPGPADPTDDGPAADEVELLAAFDRLSPQGSLGWALTDSLRRLEEPTGGPAATAPWRGLPDDLWERGRAAKAGQRMMGDVVDRLAELMDANARAVLEAGDRELRDRLVAAWDAVRFLAARVERLERRVDPVADLLLDPDDLAAAPDLSAWTGEAPSWFAAPDGERPVLVGESCTSLAGALRAAGHRVRDVEPRGTAAWRAAGRAPAGDVVLDDVAGALASSAPGSLSGVVLAGAVDRLDLPGQLALARDALVALAPGGTLALLVTDGTAWEDGLTVAGRDLLAGRPLHPETWVFLLARLGVSDPVWHRPTTGAVHAVVGRVAS
jgi:hypothetical protein